ncbi:MAG: hypothetical protein HY692_03845 [Cyanobacteria bacterium NC_groundwater_1444_Ag_S-0.65um_54_12]|nr:hypothetical protein [Cyanobacteria bacterium NC_groundwater_1444_Ag_S-0.65um_54_12]
MKRLLSIPILHSVTDMGSMGHFLKEEYTRRYGSGQWERHCQEVSRFWEGVRTAVRQLEIPARCMRIYQDGLPRCKQELVIVREVAAKGSANYALVLELVAEGACLEGTEDPDLLRRELQQLQELAAVRDPEARQRLAADFKEQMAETLEARDRFVAQRITETLRDGEHGLLFMGLQHQVERHLNSDVMVSYLFPGMTAAPSAQQDE